MTSDLLKSQETKFKIEMSNAYLEYLKWSFYFTIETIKYRLTNWKTQFTLFDFL